MVKISFIVQSTKIFFGSKLKQIIMIFFKTRKIEKKKEIQDGPSLESSSYLNVSLRYLGPGDLGTPGPWNP